MHADRSMRTTATTSNRQQTFALTAPSLGKTKDRPSRSSAQALLSPQDSVRDMALAAQEYRNKGSVDAKSYVDHVTYLHAYTNRVATSRLREHRICVAVELIAFKDKRFNRNKSDTTRTFMLAPTK
jgi:hypothetical protein